MSTLSPFYLNIQTSAFPFTGSVRRTLDCRVGDRKSSLGGKRRFNPTRSQGFQISREKPWERVWIQSLHREYTGRLKQTDRTCWTIQIHSDLRNWATPVKIFMDLSLVRLMKTNYSFKKMFAEWICSLHVLVCMLEKSWTDWPYESFHIEIQYASFCGKIWSNKYNIRHSLNTEINCTFSCTISLFKWNKFSLSRTYIVQ